MSFEIATHGRLRDKSHIWSLCGASGSLWGSGGKTVDVGRSLSADLIVSHCVSLLPSGGWKAGPLSGPICTVTRFKAYRGSTRTPSCTMQRVFCIRSPSVLDRVACTETFKMHSFAFPKPATHVMNSLQARCVSIWHHVHDCLKAVNLMV